VHLYGGEVATWVLLRGLMRDGRHWGDFTSLLGDHLAKRGIALVTADLPGCGRLANSLSPLSLSDYVEPVWRQIDANTRGPVVLIGLSMGGMVALAMAAAAPQRVAHLVLMNASAANLSPWYCRCSIGGVLLALRHSVRVPGTSRLEALILALTSHRHSKDPELVRRWSQYRLEQPISFANTLRQLWAAVHFSAPQITSPISIIYGEQDRLVEPGCSLALGNFYAVPALGIVDCGHDIALDQPESLLATLVALIKPEPLCSP
jgi:pimeloyl-ACP methyl ester carboxylesterase